MNVRRAFSTAGPAVWLACAAVGCGPSYEEGPIIDSFGGQLTKNGSPISLHEGEFAMLSMTHKKTREEFGVPVAANGTFDIGWMPVGEYAVGLLRAPDKAAYMQGKERGSQTVTLPDFSLVEGQTQYLVEVGRGVDLSPLKPPGAEVPPGRGS